MQRHTFVREFQSTPPAEARGDVPVLFHYRYADSMFQSTPPAEARGDTASVSRMPAMVCFNPLPPPKRGETVWLLRTGRVVLWWFQSTPPAEARGDAVPSGRTTVTDSGFNPLPPPKRGETCESDVIRASFGVSIHSPRRSEGRQLYSSACLTTEGFQSTPPAEARGDGRPWS